MSRPGPLTDAERRTITKMHAAGKSRNDIAAALARSPSTITKAARDLGLSFDRSQTAAATDAKQADNRARRAELVRRMYGRGESVLDRLEADRYRYTAQTVTGIETANLDHVPAQDEKHLSGAVAAYLSSAERLERIDADTHAAAARSMLSDLADALGIRGHDTSQT